MKRIFSVLVLIAAVSIISGCVTDSNQSTTKKTAVSDPTGRSIDTYMKTNEGEQLRETGGRGM